MTMEPLDPRAVGYTKPKNIYDGRPILEDPEWLAKVHPDAKRLPIGMSNYDGQIDEGLDEALRAEPTKVFATHAAWNFAGRVWFENSQFHELIWRHHIPIEILKADTLQELMAMANEAYGSE